MRSILGVSLTVSLALLLAILPAIVIARILLDRELKSTPTHPFIAQDLRPVELSYLANGGDLFGVLLVMSVDLLQRVVKGKLSGESTPQILDYEERMWQMTKDFVAETASNKIDSYLPDKIAADPVGYVKRVGRLYETIVNMLRVFAKEIIADPRRIRKYFSFGWILRLAVDFSTSTYRDRFREELGEHLIDRGLLVSKEKIEKRSKLYFSIAIIFVLMASALTFLNFAPAVGIALIASALATTAVLRTALFIGSFVPFYSELGNIIGFISRKDWRINALRTILYSVTGIAILALLFIFLAGAIAGWALLELALREVSFDKLFYLFTLTLAFLGGSSLFFRGLQIRSTTVATTLGETQLAQKRTALSRMGPFVSFKEMLASEKYDPTFSEVVAIYGIEPLIFLA